MPTNPKIDYDVLNELIGKGKSVTDIAKYFEVSPSAVVQAKKRLKAGVVRRAAIESHRIVAKHNDVVSRMQKSLDEFDLDLARSLDLLEEAATVGEKATVLRLKTDIMDRQGKQISRIVDTMRAMADFQVMATFIAEVLDVVERVNKSEKQKILRALEQSCGASISTFIGASRQVPAGVSSQGADDSQGLSGPDGGNDGSGPGEVSGGE